MCCVKESDPKELDFGCTLHMGNSLEKVDFTGGLPTASCKVTEG